MSAEDAQLSPEQVSRRNGIHAFAMVVGVLVALAVGAVLWFSLAGNYPVMRYVFIVAALPTAYLVGQWPTAVWLTASARCGACSAEYGVSQTGKEETFLSATPRRRESVVGRSISGPNEGKTLVRKESWTEERYQVVVTWTCSVCGDMRQKHSVRTSHTNKVSDDVYRR
ncbi:hypothetical protein [Pseudoxanthomonas suwonensis]|uniref:hypothetical protein n=1 Tax=Pseudoxanthomonas suwonensis TaxID=314722 RepID=UPI00049088EC|nr:hypothetical protein [Pseudoxanthomonas suwonensis]